MAIRFQRGDCNYRVAVVRRAYMHNVDAAVGKQLFVITVDLGAFGPVLLSRFLRAFFDNVAESNEFSCFLLGQTRQMLVVGDTAAADNCDFECLSHE
ncbi:hypothetical protein D3C73_1383720 [compost metagenome]